MQKSLRTALVAAATSLVALVASSSAMAAAPTGDYAQFKYCPYNDPTAVFCVLAKTSSGSFSFGGATVPITASTPITLQGGLRESDANGNSPFINASGADTLSRTKLKVPGGLIGLVSTGGWSGVLINLFNAAVASANDVYATAELAGPITFNAGSFLSGSSAQPAITLPVKIHLENPFLGSNCYIGSSSAPVRLKLITGTTAPPSPNTPITGSPGTLSQNTPGTVLTFSNNSLVDNSFAVPAASDCGFTFIDKFLITGGVNLREGLPSAAGHNAAIMNGTNQLGYAPAVAGSVR